eukprot:553850-Lingulodinium_polyedra.AAC.1
MTYWQTPRQSSRVISRMMLSSGRAFGGGGQNRRSTRRGRGASARAHASAIASTRRRIFET